MQRALHPETGDRAVEIARDLVRFDTTTGDPGYEPAQERACQEYIRDLLEAARFEIDLWEPQPAELEDHPMYLPGQHWRDRPVLVGRLNGSGNGRSLMLNGHIDTVPAGDLDAWSVDPWLAEIRENQLLGRGAADMKGGVAAMLSAALALAEGPRLRGDLLVAVVTDEEVNGMGTIAALRRGYRAEAAIVPEPTGLDVWIAFRGILVGEVEVEGRSGHVEVRQPHWSEGGAVNAIHSGLALLDRLRTINGEWASRPDKQHPLCSTGELHVTKIEGGDFYSNVPERLRATLNVTYTPGEEDEAGYGERVKHEIQTRLRASAQLDEWLALHPPTIRWSVDFPPAEIPPDEEIVSTVADITRSARGKPPRILGLDTWDDTVSLIRAGIPAISFGPGSNDQAHATDEFVDLDQLRSCAGILTELGRRWCASASSGRGGAPG